MIFKKYFPLILVIILLKCSSSPPIWVDDRPNDLKYWHGIGFAKHSEFNNPKMLAKEFAIHEVSSQIKINVSSELDILTSDVNGSVDNVINSIMNSRVSLLLPELEFVDNYSTDIGVYFYVRLNKDSYYKSMKRLRDNAKDMAFNYVVQSDEKFGKGSLVLIQKAWQEIFPFNDEPIEVQYKNQKTNLFLLIRKKQEEFADRILIKANLNKSPIRTIIDRSNIIHIKVMDRNTGKMLDGIPIEIIYNDEKATFFSDKKGSIEYDIGTINKKSISQILFSVAYAKIVDDPNYAKNILTHSKDFESLKIEVIPSKVIIYSKEKNLNKLMTNRILEPVIKEMLSGYVEFVNNKPDFHINIDANTLAKSQIVEPGFPFFSYGNASVTFVESENDQEFFVSILSDVKGGDFGSQRAAGIRAYDQMKKSITQELRENLLGMTD
tara:strand:+ start:436 stop:1746 length:1311 start_codon:yes stop_codon:yes gene_type:complete